MAQGAGKEHSAEYNPHPISKMIFSVNDAVTLLVLPKCAVGIAEEDAIHA